MSKGNGELPTSEPGGISVRWVAVNGLAAAGVLHVLAAGLHLSASIWLWLALGVAGLLQFVGAVGLTQGWRFVGLVGLATTAAALVAWLISRTIGLGALTGIAVSEPVGVLDLTTVIIQVIALVAGIRHLARVDIARAPALAGVGTLIVAGLLVGATSATLIPSDNHHHDGTESHDDHDDGVRVGS